MDRQTLANYGWVVIVTLVLAVMLGLATPFGKYVGMAVSNTIQAYKGAGEGAVENIDTMQSEWDELLGNTTQESIMSPNELAGKGYSFYSSFSLAIEDAKTLTTSNADANKNNAVASVKIDNGLASVTLLKNDSSDSFDITVPIEINLNRNTLTFNKGCGASFSTSATVKNGTINVYNRKLPLDFMGDKPAKISFINMNVSTDTDYTETSVYAICSETTAETKIESFNASVNSNAASVYGIGIFAGSTTMTDIDIQAKTTDGTTLLGVYLANDNASIKNADIKVESIKAATRGININNVQNLACENVKIDCKTNSGKIFGIYANTRTKLKKYTLTNSDIHVSSQTADTYGIQLGGDISCSEVEINGGNFFAESTSSLSEGSGNAIIIKNCKTTINSTQKYPLISFGKNAAIEILSVNNPPTSTINGGTYKSTNHTGYFVGNVNIKDAKFISSGCSNYASTKKSGLYFGDANTDNGNWTNNLYNCEVAYETVNDMPQYTIAAKGQGYYAPKEINFYNCKLKQGSTSMFSYNRVNQGNHKQYTKFNLYEKTKLYYSNGNEISKSDLTNAINTWRTNGIITFVNKTTYLDTKVVDTNKIIGIYYDTPDLNEDRNVFNYLTNDANIYDYRS